MARGKFKGFGGGQPNMNNLMKQAQKMQESMKEVQEEIEKKEITTTAGGGAIEVVVTGAKKIKSINIDKDIIDPDDAEMLQDLIIAAVNDALVKIEKYSEEEMGKVTGGLGGLPGM